MIDNLNKYEFRSYSNIYYFYLHLKTDFPRVNQGLNDGHLITLETEKKLPSL